MNLIVNFSGQIITPAMTARGHALPNSVSSMADGAVIVMDDDNVTITLLENVHMK